MWISLVYDDPAYYAKIESEFWDGKSLKVEHAKTLYHLTGNRFTVTERTLQAKLNL